MKNLLAIPIILSITTLAFNSCHKKSPVEKAGNAVEKSIEKAGDAVKDAGDAVKDSVNHSSHLLS